MTSSSLTATAAVASSSKNTGRNQSKKQQGYYNPAVEEELLTKRKESHAAAQAKKGANPKYKTMQSARKKLPAWEHSSLVVDLIKKHQVVIVSGETGCGKSTQVPQFLLDDKEIGPGLKMAVTQPRRISAIAVAERVASERMEEVGKTVGYNIRLESEVSEGSQVVFMTPGVLLRKLGGDPELREFNVVMIDEVHGTYIFKYVFIFFLCLLILFMSLFFVYYIVF
jgi:HrpA-like RNA helicase